MYVWVCTDMYVHTDMYLYICICNAAAFWSCDWLIHTYCTDWTDWGRPGTPARELICQWPPNIIKSENSGWLEKCIKTGTNPLHPPQSRDCRRERRLFFFLFLFPASTKNAGQKKKVNKWKDLFRCLCRDSGNGRIHEVWFNKSVHPIKSNLRAKPN